MISGTQPGMQGGTERVETKRWRVGSRPLGDTEGPRMTRGKVSPEKRVYFKPGWHLSKTHMHFILFFFFFFGLNIVPGGRREAIIPPSAEA